MDATDARMISILQMDGKTSNAGIARAAAVTEGTVRRRLKRLMDEGFIKIVALVDPRPMGYKSEALIGIQAEPQMIDEVAEAIAELNEVSWLVVTTGGYDIFAWVAVASSEELGSFLSRKSALLPA